LGFTEFGGHYTTKKKPSKDSRLHIDLNQLFDRMSAQELDDYTRDGKLPDWFTNIAEPATTTNPHAVWLGCLLLSTLVVRL
jgi:hypothetical protein